MRVGGPGICGGTSPAPPAGSQFGGAHTRITRSCIPCLLLRGKVTRLIVASSESRSFEEAPQLASHSCFADCFVWPRAEAIGILVDESMRRRRHVVKSARGAYVTGRGSGGTGRCTCASGAHGPRRQQLMRRHRQAWQPSSTRSWLPRTSGWPSAERLVSVAACFASDGFQASRTSAHCS